LIFCFLGFLASRLLLCSPLAMSTSLDLFVTSELDKLSHRCRGKRGDARF
jgi:hypothetical protein